jgi:hypothetical protein
MYDDTNKPYRKRPERKFVIERRRIAPIILPDLDLPKDWRVLGKYRTERDRTKAWTNLKHKQTQHEFHERYEYRIPDESKEP